MSKAARYVALTALLAGFAGLLGGLLGGTYLSPRMQGEPALHELVHHDLDLTPDQERRLELIEARFAMRRRALEAELREANAELATAITGSRRYGPEVQAAIDHFHGAMGELQKQTVLHVFDMRAVLTSAQAERFDRRVAGSLTEDAR